MKFTIILEFWDNEKQECRMRVVEVQGTKRIAIKVSRDLIKEYEAMDDMIVDGCRIEDTDEQVVWSMWYEAAPKVLS